MLYAIDENGDKIPPQKNTQARCPCCDSLVNAKMGLINIHHWAHIATEINCNHKPMSEWHYEWQSLFPKKNVEIYVNKQRRADVLTDDGISIEFQSSPISIEEIYSRNSLSNNMIIWVHNFMKQYDNKQFVNIKLVSGKKNLYHAEWLNAHKIFDRDRSTDMGIWFQFTPQTLAKICWIANGIERTEMAFYSYPKQYLVDFINDKCEKK